ncbi:phage tail assembly chaperone [Sphingomonas pituitosa]|uniref:phage tail assembly chaperone n=1 Tax=Sphingomonas pituitosa TaxID=99597 RepID=UPI0008327E76|nr:hypothetical protein [Sphingomonas pituitosa]
MKANGIRTPMMPPNPMPHIINWLVEIGLSEAAGMGVGPISWREINEWQRATCVTLSPWEARLIKTLSTTYVVEGKRAESENCPPPWRSEVTEAEKKAEVSSLAAVFG